MICPIDICWGIVEPERYELNRCMVWCIPLHTCSPADCTRSSECRPMPLTQPTEPSEPSARAYIR